MMIKYRVSEVAKDFGVPSKEVIGLLAKYVDTPKKSATALEENELDLVFEYFTQKNSVENFDAYFATAAEKKEAEKAPAPEKPVVIWQYGLQFTQCPTLDLGQRRFSTACPFSISRMLCLLPLRSISSAVNMPAGPAPTMTTSFSIWDTSVTSLNKQCKKMFGKTYTILPNDHVIKLPPYIF